MRRIDKRAIELWQVDHYSLGMIGEFYGVSRPAVKKYLNRRGIPTAVEKIPVPCYLCKRIVYKHRSHIRNTRHQFCCLPCYYETLAQLDYTEDRDSQRNARKALYGLFRPTHLNSIHFIDGNPKNDDVNNIIVFEFTGAKRRWERAGGINSGVIPVWPPAIRKKALKVREQSYGRY